jgi:hypothetical protein
MADPDIVKYRLKEYFSGVPDHGAFTDYAMAFGRPLERVLT